MSLSSFQTATETKLAHPTMTARLPLNNTQTKSEARDLTVTVLESLILTTILTVAVDGNNQPSKW